MGATCAKTPSAKISVLCLVHFEPRCFTRPLDIDVDKEDYKARRLLTGAVPVNNHTDDPPCYRIKSA